MRTRKKTEPELSPPSASLRPSKPPDNLAATEATRGDDEYGSLTHVERINHGDSPADGSNTGVSHN